jgi:hypothetical protein
MNPNLASKNKALFLMDLLAFYTHQILELKNPGPDSICTIRSKWS